MSEGLHIISGTFRNRRLKSPKGTATRPTSAVLRKSVFDICMHQIEDARLLDLYAGSGAIGLEALSRGASHATFIDRDRHALSCIHENIALLDVATSCTVIMADALTGLKRLQKAAESFDIIYIDPPYDKTEALPIILGMLDETTLLRSGGTVFVEEGFPSHLHPEKLTFKHLVHQDTRRFSQSLLHQFLKKFNS